MAASFAQEANSRFGIVGSMPSSRHRNAHRQPRIASLFCYFRASGCRVAKRRSHYHTTTHRLESDRVRANSCQRVRRNVGRLQTVPLDDQVDAQPLVVPGVQITAGIIRHARCGLCGDRNTRCTHRGSTAMRLSRISDRHIDHIVRA